MADTTASTAGVKVKQETDKITSKSLAKMAEKKVLEDLADSFKTHARSATFACGGSVPFSTNVKTEDPDDGTESDPEPRKIRPVQVRFGEDGKGNTVIIPDAKASSKQFQALFSACQPASFGRGGEEVLDEDYRKAGKLDHDDFATSFCPYEAGIIDVVAQLLLPQTSQEKHMRSIRAELYKLNIYSAPSGKFKAHVDTPRSKAQIGSLVVSVPSEHKGISYHHQDPHIANQLSLAANLSFVISVRRLYLTGPRLQPSRKKASHTATSQRSNGQPSTVTASTRSWK